MVIKTLLVSQAELNTLKKNKASWNGLYTRVAEETLFNFDEYPIKDFSVESSYTDTGHTENFLSLRLSLPSYAAYRSALLYKLDGNKKYAWRAQELIDDWYKTLRRVNGNAAQGVIGFHFLGFVIAASFVQDVKRTVTTITVNPKTKKKTTTTTEQEWDIQSFKDFLIKTIIPQSRNTYKNNIASWWVALEAAIYGLHDDNDKLEETLQVWKDQINDQVCVTSGVHPCNLSFVNDLTFDNKQYSLPDEIVRTPSSDFTGSGSDKARKGRRGISYSHYGLEPWTICAEILKKKGIDAYATDEGRIFQSLFNKMVTWVDDPSTFPYLSPKTNAGVTITNTADNLSNVKQCTYFAPLVKRFDGLKRNTQADKDAITKAKTLLKINGSLLGSQYQLDLLFYQKWNPPANLLPKSYTLTCSRKGLSVKGKQAILTKG